MKTKTAIQFTVIVSLCLLAFYFGRLSNSKNVVTYAVNGYPTSFNRAWPTYGLPLTDYEAILVMLQGSHSKEAIPFVDGLLDITIYDAKCRRSLLRGRDLEILDSALIKVARYRKQYPRPIDVSTNGFGNPTQLQQHERWVAKQKQLDVFLDSFLKTNANLNPRANK